MQKKKAKKSWKKHNLKGCFCFYCVGEFFERLISKTRVRKKFSKYPQKNFED